MTMTLSDLFKTVGESTTRPLLAYQIIFFCIDKRRLNHDFILKNEIDEALCSEAEKRKGFAKNSSRVLSALEQSGILKKFSVVNGELVEYRGTPYPVAVQLEDAVINAFFRSSTSKS